MGAALAPAAVVLIACVVGVAFPPPVKSSSAAKEASPPPELLTAGPSELMAIKSPPEPLAVVVTSRAELAGEVPTLSVASTVKLYAVEAERPVTANEVPVAVPRSEERRVGEEG